MGKLVFVVSLAALLVAGPAAGAQAGTVPAPKKDAPVAKPPAPAKRVLTAEERTACGDELDVLEKRAKLFEAQGLSRTEIARRNEASQAALEDCLRNHRLNRDAERERAEDLAELERRAGPDASDATRAEAWAQIRRGRLASKPPSRLTPEERAELAAGSGAELAETRATLDSVHARDPAFMRMVHSSLACYHGVRRDRLKDELAHEDALAKIGEGDCQRVYALKNELKLSEEVLARSKEAAKGYPQGLARCTEEKVAVLAHCLANHFEGKKVEPACESEEIQQYLRFIK
jgi:hypothetical protein